MVGDSQRRRWSIRELHCLEAVAVFEAPEYMFEFPANNRTPLLKLVHYRSLEWSDAGAHQPGCVSLSRHGLSNP